MADNLRTFEVVDSEDTRVIEDLREDDVNVEEYIAPGGDFWIDCDYLVRPDGTVIDFVLLMSSQHHPQEVEFAVVHDADELDSADKATLTRFMRSMSRGGIYDALRTDLPHMGHTVPFPEQNTWNEDMREWAKREGKYLIAFRGGVGYGYGFYDMGTAADNEAAAAAATAAAASQ